jgi:hypothetical protein
MRIHCTTQLYRSVVDCPAKEETERESAQQNDLIYSMGKVHFLTSVRGLMKKFPEGR